MLNNSKKFIKFPSIFRCVRALSSHRISSNSDNFAVTGSSFTPRACKEVEIAEKCSPRVCGGKNGSARTMINLYFRESFVLFSFREERDDERAHVHATLLPSRLLRYKKKKKKERKIYLHIHISLCNILRTYNKMIRSTDNTEHPAFKFNP